MPRLQSRRAHYNDLLTETDVSDDTLLEENRRIDIENDSEDDCVMFKVVALKKAPPLKPLSKHNGASSKSLSTRQSTRRSTTLKGKKPATLMPGQSMLSGWLTTPVKAKTQVQTQTNQVEQPAQDDPIMEDSIIDDNRSDTANEQESDGKMILDEIDVPFFSKQKRAQYIDHLLAQSPVFESFTDSEEEDVELDVNDSASDASFLISDGFQSDHTNNSSIGTMSDPDESVRDEESDSDIEPVPKRMKLSSNAGASARAMPVPRPVKQKVTQRAFVDDDDDDNHVGNDSSVFQDKFKYRLGIDDSLPPMSSNAEIFEDIVEKSVELGMSKVVEHLKGYKLRVGTMCSGTESPILALNRLSEFLPDHGLELEIDHVFSAEIVPFKQAYIENNFPGSIIFRDVVEVGNKENDVATTVYGSKAVIPGDIDILIAGSSCVDFSNLNTRKKEVDDGGESGDTFGGVRNYAEKYSPKIVILENVKGSGKVWGDLTRHMMDAGYTCKHSFLDPKDYYIPQTRERGYMVCISRKLGTPHERSTATDRYINKLQSFQRAASSSAECFLLDHDDPRIVGARTAAAFDPVRAMADWDWVRNMVGHRNYRNSLGLGHKHFITQWEDGGFAKGPDFYDRQWFVTQGERVYDMIDISWLRGIVRGYDQNHKFRFLDVSQNPFNREEDTKAAGIVGCITPKGIHFSSTRGGAIHGIECIALQGLPIDKLTFTRETHSQLKDLAGNAMTTTVVGAVLYSALLSTYKWLPSGKESNPAPQESSVRTLKEIDESRLVSLDFGTANTSHTLATTDVTSLALKTIRLCHCEDLSTLTTVDLQRCVDCGHTSCVACGVDKKHHRYQHYNPQRQSPATFIAMMRQKLPTTMKLAGLSIDEMESKQNDANSRAWHMCKNAITKAIEAELHFESIKRSSIWTATYASDFAQLELKISSSTVEWLLFVKPDRTLPGNHAIRRLLSHPVLRMKPSESDIMKGDFQIWVFQGRKIPMKITPFGSMKSSFQDVIGLSQYTDTYVYEQYRVVIENEDDAEYLDIDVEGVYKKMDCQHVVPMGSLHIREASESKPRLALFMHHDRLGAPEDDGFIFSNDTRRLNHYDHRRVVAALPPQWRPTIFKPADAQDLSIGDNMVPVEPKRPKESVLVSVTGHWCPVPQVSYLVETGLGCDIQVAAQAPTTDPTSQSCAVSHAIIKCTAIKPRSSLSTWAKGKWMTVDELNYRNFFTEFAWLMQKSSVALNYNEWIDAACHESHCTTCAPVAPSMQWTIQSEEKKGGGQTKKDKHILVPVENPHEAAPFERAMRSRPEALTVQFIWNESGVLELKMGFNPEALMHRAFAKLIGDSPPEDSKDPKTSWRLTTDSIESTMPELTPFKLRDNLRDDEALQPAGFHKCFKLRPEQLRSLHWMIEQENNPRPFIEVEIEEAAIPQIGWRGEGRAQRAVTIQGGVLADATGYGKTITSLALMSHQRARDSMTAKAHVYGRINIKATLILVPNQLPKQWFAEANRFLRKPEYNIKLVESIKDLQSTTFSDFEKADVIIAPWSLFDNEEYLFLLAQLSGMVELPTKPDARIVGAWYSEALKKLESHVELMKDDPSMLSSTIASTFEQARDDAAQVESYVPSKRITGQAYQDAKAKKAKAKTPAEKHANYAKQHALKPRKVSAVFNLQRLQRDHAVYQEMKCPLLELFQYSRVIVDEYAYTATAEGPINTIITNLSSRARWILSATPPMETFADIKFMARSLGINLGVDDLTPGVVKTKTIEALIKEKTKAELFQSFKKPPSGAWHESRWLHAKDFLAQFVRQNQAELATIPGSEHVMAVTLPPVERATYVEIYKTMAAAGFVVKPKSRQVADKERVARDLRIIGTSRTSDEVLLKAASYVDLQEDDTKNEQNTTAAMKVRNHRVKTRNGLTADIAEKLRAAEWLARNNGSMVCSHYVNWKKSIRGQDRSEANDDEAKQSIIDLLDHAEANYQSSDRRDFYRTQDEINADDDENKAKKASVKGNKEAQALLKAENKTGGLPLLLPKGVNRNNQLRAVLKLLCKFSSDLSELTRTLRYSTAVCNLEASRASNDEDDMDVDQLFECKKCLVAKSTSDMFLLSSCGHMYCRACRSTLSETCAYPGCQYPFKDFQVSPANDYVQEEEVDEISVIGCYGKKLIQIIRLIKRIPAEEQVLLFIQQTDLMKVVDRVLQMNDITVTSLSSNNAAQVLTEFQQGKGAKGTKRKTKVLMMNIGDSSAAGANLTNANHVIFVSPYLTESSGNGIYNAAMIQAKGRARRFGQTKPVHFYQFLSLNTIDVNILQNRTEKVVTHTDLPLEPEFKPYKGFRPSPFTLEERLPNVDMEKQGMFRQPDISDVFVPEGIDVGETT